MNQHVSHQRGRSRVAYQFHPYFGREVNVIRGIRAGEEPAIIADVGEDTRIMVPSWMFDENCCRMVIIEDRPRVAVDALLRLRVLLDAQNPTPVGEEGKHNCTEEYEDSQT
jgi:hypothetical protein